MTRFLKFVPIALAAVSCEYVEKAQDAIETCGDACSLIEECGVTPPSPAFGNIEPTGSGGADCAINCAGDERELHGYADCQIQCINESTCDTIPDCWRPRSELYQSYCLADREIPVHEPDVEPDNGSNSGSQEADEILQDPSVAIAIDGPSGGGFTVNYGDQPPRLVGKYHAVGTIDEASNARPVGSLIDTEICFWDFTETEGGVVVSYCEDGVPGEDTAPLTGTDDAFTAYFEYDGQATVLFSGSMNGDGTLSQVEALVVYTYGVDIWEHSFTDWQPVGDCTSCE